MLDLNAPVRTVAGVALAADEGDPLAFYVLPPAPRVAAVEGVPQLELLRFVRSGEVVGGHLRLVVELAHPPARLDAVRAALAAELREEEAVISLLPLPVQSATAELLFAGRETAEDGGIIELVRRGYGRTAAGFGAPHTASFAVDLEPDGVRLMEAALSSGGAPIGVIYRLGVEGLWPAQRTVAHIDWGRVYDHFSVHWKEGAFLYTEDVRKVTERLIESRAIQIQVVQGLAPAEGEAPPDPGPALAWIQRELVERFCEPLMPLSREPAHASLGTVGEIFGVGSAFAVKKLTQIERAVADVDFQRAVVVARTWTAQAHLADLLDGASPAAHIADAGIDHPFFQRFALRVGLARPLPETHLAEVVLHFDYGTHRDSARLTAESPEARFEAWADAAPDRTWTLRPEVTFAADAPLDPGAQVQLPPFTGQSRALTLDFEALLGLARFDVMGTADPRVLFTRASLAARRGAEERAEREVVLMPAAPRGSAWFRDLQPGDRVEVAAKHLLADGRAVEGPRQIAETRAVRLPPPFPGALTVQLLPDDDWSGLERVVVALQKAADLPAGSFTFTGSGAALAVNLDMPDPTDRTFRYRSTRTWSDGAVEEDDWLESDVPIVLVGRVAANKLVVDVTPVGPELPVAGVLLIEVELSYIDAENQVRDLRTAVLRARADRFRWEVALRDPKRRGYQYRITTHRTSGEQQVGPWTTSAERILPIPIVRA